MLRTQRKVMQLTWVGIEVVQLGGIWLRPDVFPLTATDHEDRSDRAFTEVLSHRRSVLNPGAIEERHETCAVHLIGDLDVSQFEQRGCQVEETGV